MPRKAEDLTGRRFGRLTVTGRAENGPPPARNPRWHCACDCGNTATLYGHRLKGGQRHCGIRCPLWVEYCRASALGLPTDREVMPDADV